ncbi:MAG: hypothetical protein ACK5D7_08220 [Planctomycetota bacterium]
MSPFTEQSSTAAETFNVVTPPAAVLAAPEVSVQRNETIVNPVCQLAQAARAECSAAISGAGDPTVGPRETTSLTTVKRELQYYRNKAIEQDIEIFEMRALLQSGKG